MRPREVPPTEARTLLAGRPGLRLLDVRDPAERAVASLPGSVLVTPGVAAEILEDWPRDTPILVFCHHGRRSLLFGLRLLAAGFTDVGNLAGGIERWSVEVEPSVPRYTVRYGEGVIPV